MQKIFIEYLGNTTTLLNEAFAAFWVTSIKS